MKPIRLTSILYIVQPVSRFYQVCLKWIQLISIGKQAKKNESHCSHNDFKIKFKLGFISFPATSVKIYTVGPALVTLDFEIKAIIKIRTLVNMAVITLRPFKQLVIFKVYFRPKWIGWIFFKSLPHAFAIGGE